MIPMNNLLRSVNCHRSHLTNYVSVRWKSRPRKPFWLGLAKTKLFRIPERKVIPSDQVEELKRLGNVYDRQMEALHNFIMANVSSQAERTVEIELRQHLEEAKLLHERWNAESARLREERLKRREEELVEAILSEVTENQEKMKHLEAKMEDIVKREIEISNTYITEENLDEAIDKCLASVSDYNYAMDLSGNVYKGDSMNPVNASSEKLEMVHESTGTEESKTTNTL